MIKSSHALEKSPYDGIKALGLMFLLLNLANEKTLVLDEFEFSLDFG